MPKGKDVFTKELFEQGKPGFHRVADGRVFDDEGNEYDPNTLDLIQEAPSDGLRAARRIHLKWSDAELAELAGILQRQIEAKRAKGRNKKHERN
jgi:hypothetical protein